MTGRRGSTEKEQDRQSFNAKVQQLTQMHEEVNEQINHVSALRRAQGGSSFHKVSPGGGEGLSEKGKLPLEIPVMAFSEELPSVPQPSVSPAVVVALEQKLATVEASLATERSDRERERSEAERRLNTASDLAKRVQVELEEQMALTSKRMREMEEQHHLALTAAVREARESKEATDRLEREMRVMEEKMRRADAAIHRDAAGEERRWSERQDRLERQLSDAESNEKRMRAELSRKDEDCEQIRRSLQSIQQQLQQSQEAERRCNAQLDGVTAEVARLRQSAHTAEELHRREREEHYTAMRQLQTEREKDKAEWLEEKQRLVRGSEEVEQRLSALHRHYLQRQQDVNDLKELLKLSVRKEREAVSEVEQRRAEAAEALRVAEEWKRRWATESREWEAQRTALLQHQALHSEVEQKSFAEVMEKQRKSDEAALQLRSDNTRLHKEVEELNKSADATHAVMAFLSSTLLLTD